MSFFSHFCHDENIRGHSFNRFEVREVQCRNCGVKQSPKKNCVNCNNLFGKVPLNFMIDVTLSLKFCFQYFCKECNFYDTENDESVIFHCGKCGICRKRATPSTAYTHCNICDICIPSSTNLSHEVRLAINSKIFLFHMKAI